MYILQPCVTLSTLCCPQSDTVVLLIWVCFCFCFFSVSFFFFLFGSLGFFFSHLPLSPPLLFMKLENLKDCCVFVNNKTIVHSVLVNVPCPNCYFWSPSAQGCGLFLIAAPRRSPPPPRCERTGPDPVPHPHPHRGARVTLSASRPRGQGKVRPPPRPVSPARPGLASAGACQRSNGLFLTACQFLNCVAVSFFMGKKRKKKKIVPFNLFAQTQKTYSI